MDFIVLFKGIQYRFFDVLKVVLHGFHRFLRPVHLSEAGIGGCAHKYLLYIALSLLDANLYTSTFGTVRSQHASLNIYSTRTFAYVPFCKLQTHLS